MNGLLTRKSYTVFKNWLALGRAVFPGQARPQMSKHQKHIVNTVGHSIILSDQPLLGDRALGKGSKAHGHMPIIILPLL